jgi:hypothetical protein
MNEIDAATVSAISGYKSKRWVNPHHQYPEGGHLPVKRRTRGHFFLTGDIPEAIRRGRRKQWEWVRCRGL